MTIFLSILSLSKFGPPTNNDTRCLNCFLIISLPDDLREKCLLFIGTAEGPSLLASNPICSIRPARIMLVSMTGHQNTEIRDQAPANAVISDNQNRHLIDVTLYESSVNVLRVQLDCAQQSDNDLLNDSCSLTYHINVWIDLNDDGKFDDLESRAHHPLLISSQGQHGTYHLEICIPPIDDTNTKVGRHRMYLSLVPSDDYRKACSSIDFSEIREYTVNIIRKATCEGKICLHTPYSESNTALQRINCELCSY